MIIPFPIERTRKPSPYIQAMVKLVKAAEHCDFICQAINEKLRRLPGTVTLWDEQIKDLARVYDVRPSDSE